MQSIIQTFKEKSKAETARPPKSGDVQLEGIANSFTDISWEPVNRSSHSIHPKVNAFSLRLTFAKKKMYHRKDDNPLAEKPHYAELRIRLAKGLYESLGWEPGEKLLLCFAKEDPTTVCMLKNPNGHSFTAEKYGKMPVARVSMNANFLREAGVDYFSTYEARYEIDHENQRLFFRITPPTAKGTGTGR